MVMHLGEIQQTFHASLRINLQLDISDWASEALVVFAGIFVIVVAIPRISRRSEDSPGPVAAS
jgi:hypothetical protein